MQFMKHVLIIYYYYCYSLDMRNIDAGNLTERLDLRKQLKCKSYRWFLENIYPENRQWHTFVSIGPVSFLRAEISEMIRSDQDSSDQ